MSVTVNGLVGLVNCQLCVYRIDGRQWKSGGSTVGGAINKISRRHRLYCRGEIFEVQSVDQSPSPTGKYPYFAATLIFIAQCRIDQGMPVDRQVAAVPAVLPSCLRPRLQAAAAAAAILQTGSQSAFCLSVCQ